MNAFGGLITMFVVYFGAAAVAMFIFGEGTDAMWFAGLLGTGVMVWIIKNQEKK